MKDSSNFSAAERVESLKAGAVAALSCLFGFWAIALGNTLILGQWWDSLAGLQVRAIDLNFALRWAMALVGGFLFGVTYRYAIRRDVNPQLKSGVVLAFGLVRAFGQLDAGLSLEGGQNAGFARVIAVCCWRCRECGIVCDRGFGVGLGDWAIVDQAL